MKNKISFLILILIFFSIKNSHSQNIEGVKQFGSEKGIIYDFCFSETGEVIIVPENNVVKIYNTNTQELLHTFSGEHTKPILSVDISQDSSMIVTGGKDSTIVIWDLLTKKAIKKLNFHSGVITSVKFSPDNKHIASASSDYTVILCDLSCDTISYTFTEHQDDVSCIDFNADGTILASSSEDKTIIFRNANSYEIIKIISNNKGFVREIKFNDDDSRFISCDDNSYIKIWKTEDLNNIKQLKEAKHGNKWILSIDLLKSGSAYVSGGIDGKIRIKTDFFENNIDVNKIIHKVRFKKGSSSLIEVAVATRGRGLLLIDTSKINNEKI